MQKLARLVAIERIIRDDEVSSQEEIIRLLEKEGISCTQATLSRNLRELGVLRIPNGKGGYRYSLSSPPPVSAGRGSVSVVSAVRQVIDANSMVIIKTLPGYASSVAVAIDTAERYEVAGTIAGDDTLLVIPRDNVSRAHIHSCLEMVLPGLHRQSAK